VFLVRTFQAWASSPTTVRTRTPKVHVTDTGLAGALLGIDADRLARDPSRAGPLLESFVVNELSRQLAAAGATRYALSHLRTCDGREVDVVLERADGRVAAVEVRGGATVRAGDARNLRWLADRVGDRFVAGVLLYTGDRVVALGDRITLLPISSLWAAPHDGGETPDAGR
jgi:predicted AAA+ superfamily ATPase